MPGQDAEMIAYETFIERAHVYVRSLLLDTTTSQTTVYALSTTVRLPRYVGVVRLSAPYLDKIDVLVDTTSTSRNLHVAAVFAHGNAQTLTSSMANHLAEVAGNVPCLIG